MNRHLILKSLLALIFLAFCSPSICQVTGDFQTKNSAGNWSNFTSWNVYNGTIWVAAVAGQLPTSTSAVFIRSGHNIAVDNSFATCNDLNLTGSTSSTISFSSNSSILNVLGNMNLFSSSQNCFGIWISGAKIVFSGLGIQSVSNLSITSGTVPQSSFLKIEINKGAGGFITNTNFSFTDWILTNGNVVIGSGNQLYGTSSSSTITINGGSWSQFAGPTRINGGVSFIPIGMITINGGSMDLATSSTLPGNGFQLSSINVINGGMLTFEYFTGTLAITTSMSVDGTSVFNTALGITPTPSSTTFNGLVHYNLAATQIIAPATYSYLKLSGSSAKTLGGPATISSSGTLELSGVAATTLGLGGFALTVSPTATNLIYSSTAPQAASANEWNSNFHNVTINNPSGVSMALLNRTIFGSLNLISGTFNIGTGGALTLNGASLNRANGYLDGTPTSNLTVAGNTGGTVLIPLLSNISLYDIAILDTRTLAMDGVRDIDLYGTFNIGPTATYDNGGESQLKKGLMATPSVIINGKFLNRDKDDFANPNGSIPSIIPTLNSNSTIEFGLNGDQFFSARSDYRNITFSGSGIKKPSSAFTPNGTLTITGAATLDASSHNISDGSTVTNFTMDGGRLILGTTTPTTQPQINGLYNLTGGVVEFAGSKVTTQAIRSLKSYYAIEVTGNNVGNSNGNINLNPDGSFTVKTNGIFMINDDAIVGSGGTESLTVENGAIFKCGNNQGFHGIASTFANSSSIDQNIQRINLIPGSTVEYTRAGVQPITNFNGLIYQNLLLAGSGDKTAPTGTLTIHGNLAKAGTSVFVPGNGTVLLDGAVAQRFAGLTYNNLILTNTTKTTQGSSTILDSIKINASTVLDVSALDTIIIHSDALKTGRVGQVDGSITNISRFTVERFIPSRRAWRFLSVPTSSSQTLKSAWQEGAITLSANPKLGYGTQIQSTAANWFSTGFDAQSLNGPSIKTYDYLTDTYTPVASLLNPFDVSLGGYMTFIRGDRTASYFGAPVTKTVLRTTGNLFTGNQPVINILSGSIIPVNNPYASPLDLTKLLASPSVTYYVWDPNRGGGFGFGAVQTFSWNGSGYTVVPGNSGSYLATNNFIESGQAFFASTLGANTTIQITESAKASTTPTTIPFVPATAPMQLRINLYDINTAPSTLSDGVLLAFGNNYSNSIDGMDAKKFGNPGENLSIKSHSELLTIERKSLALNNDTIFLNLSGSHRNTYRFELIADNLDQAGLSAYLEDTYLNKRGTLDLNGTAFTDFVIDADIQSAAPDRFRIVFETPAAGPLPVALTNVKAYKKNENISVEWTANNESHIKQYDVEKSAEGQLFDYVATHIAGNTPYNVYTWLDESAFAGYNYYRIKITDADGKTKYSKIVNTFMPGEISAINVYPNPIKDGIINLQFANQPAGIYQLTLVNKIGQIILIKEITHAIGIPIEKIFIANKMMAHDIYNLEIIRPDASKISRKILY